MVYTSSRENAEANGTPEESILNKKIGTKYAFNP
tara:strand:- start:116 stop:217 length:102 start_codon:yes stop_codon:yes gene_type:complete